MMEKELKYLSDIIQSIDLILDFTGTISSYDDYVKDIKTQSAVERQLGIIGEAVNKYNQLEPKHNIENAGQIIGLRNKLIHAYDVVDSSIIWAIIMKHLIPLKEEINQIIERLIADK